jgi:predicted metal-binding protein
MRARGKVSEDQPEVVVHVCTTCRAQGEPLEPRDQRAGARLYQALKESRRSGDASVEPVECLSVCKRPCTISFSAAGCWTYIYGDFSADDAAAIWAAAKLYAEAPQGLIPWRQRPDALKKGVVARVPPLKSSTEITV